MEKRIIDEKTGIEYVLVDDIYYPIFVLEDEGVNFGKYGRMRLNYLKEHRKELYTEMLVRDTLYEHIEDIQREALDMIERLEKQYIRQNSLASDNDFMENYNIRQQARDYADEVVKRELIYYYL
jgi:hypothetical protein